MLTHRRHRPDTGFTLVEVLVAMAVFAIVAGLAFGALRYVARDQAALASAADLEAAAAACLDRMARDLSALYVSQPPLFAAPLPGDPPPEFQMTTQPGEGASGDLFFSSLAHVSFGNPARGGIARIGYTLHPDGNGRYLIRRADHLAPRLTDEGGPADPVLCEHVRSVDYHFYGRDGEVVEHWDSASEDSGYATPRALRITLRVDGGDSDRTLGTIVFFPVQREPLTVGEEAP
jgi:general secretion pathway protein J